MVSQSGCPPVNVRIALLRWVLRLSQIRMTGGVQSAVRGGDQFRVVGFGHAAALSLRAAVQPQPVEEAGRGAGLQAGQVRDGDPAGALPGGLHHGSVPAAAPGAGLRRPEGLAGLVLEADPRAGHPYAAGPASSAARSRMSWPSSSLQPARTTARPAAAPSPGGTGPQRSAPHHPDTSLHRPKPGGNGNHTGGIRVYTRQGPTFQ
jgi:hypothetical protein